jgi:hypothetical protein
MKFKQSFFIANSKILTNDIKNYNIKFSLSEINEFKRITDFN